MEDPCYFVLFTPPSPKWHEHGARRVLGFHLDETKWRLQPQVLLKQLQKLLLCIVCRRQDRCELSLGRRQTCMRVVNDDAPNGYLFPFITNTKNGLSIYEAMDTSDQDSLALQHQGVTGLLGHLQAQCLSFGDNLS